MRRGKSDEVSFSARSARDGEEGTHPKRMKPMDAQIVIKAPSLSPLAPM